MAAVAVLRNETLQAFLQVCAATFTHSLFTLNTLITLITLFFGSSFYFILYLTTCVNVVL